MFRSTFFIVICAIMTFCVPAFSQGQTMDLKQVIKEVCANSDSVKMMKQTLTKAREMVREKWSAPLPVISGSVFAGRSYASGLGSSSSPFLPPDSMTITYGFLSEILKGMYKSGESPIYNTSISLTQPLYTFGKVGTAIKVAKWFQKATEASVNRNMQQLQLSALDSYTRVVLVEMMVAVSERSLSRKQEVNAFLERNFAMGSGVKAQVLATRSDLISQRMEVVKAKSDLKTVKMMLNSFLSKPLTDDITLDTSAAATDCISLVVPAEDEAIDKAYTQRSDLQSLSYFMEANNGGAKIFNAMYLPSIAATGSFGTQGTKPEDMIDWEKRTWTVGVGLQWSFFDGFANNAKARQYTSDATKLQIAQNTIKNMIEIEIKAAITECNQADSNVVAVQEMLAAAKEGYDLTYENIKLGSGLLSELQNAEERLSQAELGVMSARYRVVHSRAALQVAMGQNIIPLEE